MKFSFPSLSTGEVIGALAFLLTAIGLGSGWLKDRRNLKRELKKERSYKKAAEDHGMAVQYLRIIAPKLFGSVSAYERAIPDQAFRERIRIYLGIQNPATAQFEPFQLTQDQINNPECCRTIALVIEAVKKYKANNPEQAKQLRL